MLRNSGGCEEPWHRRCNKSVVGRRRRIRALIAPRTVQPINPKGFLMHTHPDLSPNHPSSEQNCEAPKSSASARQGIATVLRSCALILAAGLAALPVVSIAGTSYFFSTGDPDGRIATASRPDSAGKTEIESADDFVLTRQTTLTQATFTGLIHSDVAPGSVTGVTVEIYRVFPNDSTFPPSGNVTTRVNSPSDVEFLDRSSSDANLSFSTAVVQSSFTVANSVLNGINPIPGEHTGGDGPVTGEEVEFTVDFLTPVTLGADHYFFVPQVELSSGDFFWLSAPKPIVPPGTPFPLGFTDLQSWIRNENLDPDWLRVGTDIVGNTTYNASFSLTGSVPDSGTTLQLLGGALLAMAIWVRIRSQGIRQPALVDT